MKSLGDAQLSAPLVLPWSKWMEQAIGRTPGPITLGETILQVLTHSGHHRAQANARLRRSAPRRRSSTTSHGCGWSAPRRPGLKW